MKHSTGRLQQLLARGHHNLMLVALLCFCTQQQCVESTPPNTSVWIRPAVFRRIFGNMTNFPQRTLGTHRLLINTLLREPLYLIKNGEINTMAMKLSKLATPMIPPEINRLRIMWQAAGEPTYYSINLMSLKPDILYHPTLNMNKTGRIPKKPQKVEISLICTKKMTGYAPIVVEMKLFDRRRRPLPKGSINYKISKACNAKRNTAKRMPKRAEPTTTRTPTRKARPR